MPDVPHDETVELRLQLHYITAQRDAFKAALTKEVMDVMRSASDVSAQYELLYDQNQELKETIHQQAEEINRLTEEVEKLKADRRHPTRTKKALR